MALWFCGTGVKLLLGYVICSCPGKAGGSISIGEKTALFVAFVCDHQTHQRATTMIIDEYLPSGDPTKSFKPADNDYNISPVKRPAQNKEDYSQKINAFSDSNKGRGAITMLNHIQNYTGGQAVRFDRWIKLFDNVVAMSNWNNSDIISMLSTKMTGEAYDFLQNILESDTQDYIKIKALF